MVSRCSAWGGANLKDLQIWGVHKFTRCVDKGVSLNHGMITSTQMNGGGLVKISSVEFVQTYL